MAPVSQQQQIDFPVRKLRSSSRRSKGVPPPPVSPLKKPSPVKKAVSPSKSPCSALRSVSLNSPSRARVSLEARLDKSSSPNVSLIRPSLRPYKDLKAALNEEGTLSGREKQLETLRNFFFSKGKSLYVSGAPGTGKTACLRSLLDKDLHSRFQKIVFVNCMSLKTPQAIYKHVYSSLAHKSHSIPNDPQKEIERLILDSSCGQVLLVLDEMDQLESKNQEVLYTLFEWPFLHKSSLTLVGIANALDLTDRILPRLKLRAGICPQQLSFPAYSRAEITDILMTRINSASDENNGGGPIIQPNAVKFLAGKISALSGDIRKALDVCRRAVEIVELKARKQTLLSSSEEALTRPTVDLPLILKIVNEVYGSRVGSSLKDSDSDLPLVQKLLIASLLLMTTDHHDAENSENKRRTKASKEVPFSKLFRTYVNVCKKRNMAPVPESECISMTSLLDSRGLIGLRLSGKKKEPRLSQVSLRIDEKEVEAALKDKTLLSDILSDVSCIAK